MTTTETYADKAAATLDARLTFAFDIVKPATHWKDRISAWLTDDDVDRAGGIKLIASAIEHYTATTALWSCSRSGRWLVTAPGYRAGPAGDH